MPHSKSAALMGALVADAASMGLHWIYDPSRISEITADGSAAFVPPKATNFEGVPAYFAHAARRNGQFSQYGEVLYLAIRTMHNSGAFDMPTYQNAFAAHFGAGGHYQGYIDRPTRGTLENLAANRTSPSGIDDDQHPAVATLPAIVARYHGDAGLQTHARAAISVTNVNAEAERYGLLFTHMLHAVLDGVPLHDALIRAAQDDPRLNAALTAGETDSVAYGAVTERACHLSQGMPLSFHILQHASSYRDAVEHNIKAGGDSCGRAIIVGAMAGAAYGIDAIPMEWTLSLDQSAAVWADVQALTE